MAKLLLVQRDCAPPSDLPAWLRLDGGHLVETSQLSDQLRSTSGLHGYDLLVIDYETSKEDLEDLCRTIRAGGVHTPVLIICGAMAVAERVAMLDAGADDILTNPVSLPEMSARVRALLRRPKVIVPRRITIGDLTLDTAVKCAFQSGKRIDLSDREYALLEILVRNANRVLSLEEIVNRVSSTDEKLCASFVKVLVHRVRLKLRSSERSVVENVHGRGYVVRCYDNAALAQGTLLPC